MKVIAAAPAQVTDDFSLASEICFCLLLPPLLKSLASKLLHFSMLVYIFLIIPSLLPFLALQRKPQAPNDFACGKSHDTNLDLIPDFLAVQRS